MSEIDRRFLLGTLAGAAGISALASAARGGPLNPPAGAVVSTGKTLTEVEPRIAINAVNTPGDATAAFIISQPGSYYLTGPIATALNDGIRVSSGTGPVMIDMNGFRIAAGQLGIHQTGLCQLIVRNGYFANCGYGIITAGTTPICRTVVEGVTFENCFAAVNAASAVTMRGCLVYESIAGNNQRAVTCGPHSLITACQITSTGPSNVLAGALSTIADCTFEGSSTFGVDANSGSVVERCTFTGGSTGLRINSIGGAGGAVRGCTFSGYSVCAIDATASVIKGNVVLTPSGGSSSTSGIVANAGCDIAHNRVEGAFSAATGIKLQSSRNTVRGNGVSNFSASNGQAIWIVTAVGTGNSGNKIEGNELVNNYRHIFAAAQYNLIVRNTMSFAGGGGYFANTTNNAYGPFVLCNNTDLSTVAGTSHPQANLVY